MKKRGLSTVITTLILILLVLVAIAIVWIVVRNVIESGIEEVSLGRFTIDLRIKNIGVNNLTNNATIVIKRNPGVGNLEGIKLIFNDGSNSEIFEERNLILQELGEKTFSYILINLNLDNVETVAIAPILRTNSGKLITGRVTHTYRLKQPKGGACTPDCGTLECGLDPLCGIINCGPLNGLCPAGEWCNLGTCQPGANPCTLSSASWSAQSVVEGTAVTMDVVGSGNCAGASLNYSVYENDFIGDLLVDSFLSNNFAGPWTAQWMDDGGGDDPEYYFIATVFGTTESVQSSTPDLTVVQGAQTCAQQGGDTCNVGIGEYCPGNVLPATDTTTCCDVTCQLPTCTICSTCGNGWLNVCDRAECENCNAESCYFESSGSNCNTCTGATCGDYGTDQTTCTDDPCGFANCIWSGSNCQTQLPPGVYRSMPATVAPNGQIDVTLQVILGPSETYYTVEEYIPSGWTVTNDAGGATADPLKLAWVVITNAVDTSYVYTVQAPASGTGVFDGNYSFESFPGFTPVTTQGQTTVSVS
jgi:hypothetical protein